MIEIVDMAIWMGAGAVIVGAALCGVALAGVVAMDAIWKGLRRVCHGR